MKRFIRTKDELYDTQNLMYRTIKDNKVYRVGWDVEKPTFEADIIAEADTLEELCDEFVIENDYCGQISQSRYFDFEVAKQNIDIASNDVIYGALRIAGKGLIYVAKMNNEGALELI